MAFLGLIYIPCENSADPYVFVGSDGWGEFKLWRVVIEMHPFAWKHYSVSRRLEWTMFCQSLRII
jgi:hypothetical protein